MGILQSNYTSIRDDPHFKNANHFYDTEASYLFNIRGNVSYQDQGSKPIPTQDKKTEFLDNQNR
jgi:hypothetical protein